MINLLRIFIILILFWSHSDSIAQSQDLPLEESYYSPYQFPIKGSFFFAQTGLAFPAGKFSDTPEFIYPMMEIPLQGKTGMGGTIGISSNIGYQHTWGNHDKLKDQYYLTSVFRISYRHSRIKKWEDYMSTFFNEYDSQISAEGLHGFYIDIGVGVSKNFGDVFSLGISPYIHIPVSVFGGEIFSYHYGNNNDPYGDYLSLELDRKGWNIGIFHPFSDGKISPGPGITLTAQYKTYYFALDWFSSKIKGPYFKRWVASGSFASEDLRIISDYRWQTISFQVGMFL